MTFPLLAALLVALPTQEAGGAPRLSEVPPAEPIDAPNEEPGRRKGTETLRARQHRWRRLRVGMLTDRVAWQLGPGPRIRTIDGRGGRLMAVRELPAEPCDVDVEGERLVVTARDRRAYLFEGPALVPRGEFSAGAGIDLSPDSARAVTWGGELDGLRVVALPGGEIVREFALEVGELVVRPGRPAWDGTGAVVAVSDEDGLPWLWHEGRPIELPPLRRVHSLAVDSSGRWLAIGDELQRVLVLDAASGAEVASLTIQGVHIWPHTRALAFDATGSYLVASTGDYGMVQAWRTDGWKALWAHDYHGGNPATLHLAIDDAAARVWVWGMTPGAPAAFELATGRVLADLAGTGLEDFAPSPDGRTIAARRDGSLVLLEPDGRARLERLELEGLGAVVSRADGSVSGDASALPHVFVEDSGEPVRADRYAARERR